MCLAYIIVTIFGLVIGSFLTVVVARYPVILQRQWQTECREYLNLPHEKQTKNISLATPNSHCPYCKTSIKIHHNIPLLSYFLLRGKCATCKRPIPKLYPLIELITAIMSIAVLWRFGLTDEMLGALFFTYVLIALSFIDFNHHLLPDTLTLSTLWIGLLFNTIPLYTTLANAVWAAVIGYLFLWICAWIFQKIRHKQGMGHGDFKMIAMVGAWLGLEAMLNTLILATILGALCNLILILSKKVSWERPTPFGPYIALSAWLSLLFGSFILFWMG